MYDRILAAVEVHDAGEAVLARAAALSRDFKAALTVLHVVEYLPIDPAGDALLTTPVDLSRERAQQAEARLQQWCATHGLPPGCVRVVAGAVTAEILRNARELNADLIVVGHHPRTGLAALFSHTEQGVVSKAACDVLAIRLA